MVGATSYRIVRAIYSRSALLDKGLDAGEMRKLLEAITRTPWRICWTCGLARVCSFKLLAGPVALLIEGDNYQHWIAIRESIAHDPAFSSAFPLNQYPRDQWKVFASLRQGW
jgi:hypothetical protein